MEKREILRYQIPLKVEVKQRKLLLNGTVKDFSRKGLSVIFQDFKPKKHSVVNFSLQRPGRDVFIPALGEVIWSKPKGTFCEVGLQIKDMPVPIKAEILEHAYHLWLSKQIDKVT